MPEAVNGNNILLGRGKIYFDRFDALGAKTGELFLGNCPTFEITPSPEEIKKYSSATKAADLIASDVLRTSLGLRIVGDEFSKENLAMALFGDTSVIPAAAGTLSEYFTPVLQGRYYGLLHRPIISCAVMDYSSDPVYVLNVDYKVDMVSGRVYIIEGGGIADGTGIQVFYQWNHADIPIVRGMNQTSVKGFLRFIGDPGRGPKYECLIWRASLRSDGAIGFISDEYASFTLTGDIESDATVHPDEPHFMLIPLN